MVLAHYLGERGHERSRHQAENQQQEEQGGGVGRDEGDATAASGHDTLSILYTNAQSIVGKIDELSCTASELKPDLILLAETWCNDNTSDAFLNIQGYELQIRLDREDTAGGRGGGQGVGGQGAGRQGAGGQ